MEMLDQQHWQSGLASWLKTARPPQAWRRLPCHPQPLPFLGGPPARLDPVLQQLLDLVPRPPAAPVKAEPTATGSARPFQTEEAVELMPIGLFLRGIAFGGEGRAPDMSPSVASEHQTCRLFFSQQVDWQGSGGQPVVDLVQLSAWATAEAIERSRKAAPRRPASAREFFRQIPWSGASAL